MREFGADLGMASSGTGELVAMLGGSGCSSSGLWSLWRLREAGN